MRKLIKIFNLLFFLTFYLNYPLEGVDVQVSDYSGSRSAADGLKATSSWGSSSRVPLNLSWNITESNGIFHYVYSISGPDGKALSKEVSHFILEVSPTINKDNLTSLIKNPSIPISDGPRIFSPQDPGKSNPGLPDEIYGIKIDINDTDGSKVTFDFFSERAPIWGDFYAKDGKDKWQDVYGYNRGFGTDPNEFTKDFTSWVPTPDTKTVAVPEPSTWLVLTTFLGLLGLLVWHRKKREIKNL